MKFIAIFLFVALAACSDDSGSDNNANNGNNNANNANNVNNGNNLNNGNNVEVCGDVQNRMIEAIRGMPRDCNTDADCVIVPRAGQCECNLGVKSTSDVPGFQSVLQELIDNACTHPFACSQPTCSYDTGTAFEPKELVATCEDNTCKLIEVMQCDAYAQRVNGGVSPSGNCLTDDDCTLRTDLNPCGCAEGISTNYPILTAEGVYNMMSVNMQRCSFSCDGCPQFSQAVCVDTQGGDMRECSEM